MQSVKPVMKTNHMQSVLRPAKSQSKHKKKNQVNFNQVNDDKDCQSTRCYKKPEYTKCDKNCEDNKSVIMWPVKSVMDMQSKEPAMQSSFKKKHVPSCNDKNYQSTRCYRKKNPLKQVKSVCNNENCQATKCY